MLQALVLAAKTFIVLDRPEDLRAEEAVPLRLERAVVDGLRLLDLAIRPGLDGLGTGERDLDRVEVLDAVVLAAQQCKEVFHEFCSNSIFNPIDRISFT